MVEDTLATELRKKDVVFLWLSVSVFLLAYSIASFRLNVEVVLINKNKQLLYTNNTTNVRAMANMVAFWPSILQLWLWIVSWMESVWHRQIWLDTPRRKHLIFTYGAFIRSHYWKGYIQLQM